MSQIKSIFQRITPEEQEIRELIKALENEIRQMRKDLRADITRWQKVGKRQQQEGLRESEIRITKSWIDRQAEKQLDAIRVKEQKIIRMQEDIQNSAGIMSRQTDLF